MIAYKFLRDGRVGPFSGVGWPAPGDWLEATPGGATCAARVHACRAEDLAEWMDAELWRVELDGDVGVDCGKLVADRGRLVERVATWDPAFMAAFAEACTLRARDAALLVLAPDEAAHTTLATAMNAEEIAAVAADGALLATLDPGEVRAVGYAGDAARHVLGARAQPATAPTHAAVNGFIAAHAAAFAQDDLGAVDRERAWQTAWLTEHAGL